MLVNSTVVNVKLPKVYHILPTANLESVLRLGLYNHIHGREAKSVDFSETAVQKRRANKMLSGKSLHHFVCTFLNTKNKMSFRYFKEKRDYVILELKSGLFNAYDFYFSLHNAASDKATFHSIHNSDFPYDKIQLISNMKYEEVQNISKDYARSAMMSEFLFDTDRISSRYINRIIIHKDSVIEQFYCFLNMGVEFSIDEDNEFFFQERR